MDIEAIKARMPPEERDMVEKQIQKQIQAKKDFDAMMRQVNSPDAVRDQIRAMTDAANANTGSGGFSFDGMMGKAVLHAVAVLVALVMLRVCCKGCKGGKKNRGERLASPGSVGEHTVEIPPPNIQADAPRDTIQNNTRNGIHSGGPARSDEHNAGVGVNLGETASRNQVNSGPTHIPIGAGTRTGTLVQIN